MPCLLTAAEFTDDEKVDSDDEEAPKLRWRNVNVWVF